MNVQVRTCDGLLAPYNWTSIEHTTRQALEPDGYDTAFTTSAALGTDEALAYARRPRGERSAL